MVWLVSAVLVMPYAYVGLTRLAVGLAIFHSDALLYYIAGASRSMSLYPGWFDPPAFKGAVKLGFFAMTVLEASAVAVLISFRFRVLWLCAMLGLHVATGVLMNVLFWEVFSKICG